MSHRALNLFACSSLAFAFALPAISQSVIPAAPGRLPSTIPTSPIKRTVNDETAAATAAASAPVTGTFVAKFTIKLATAVPSGDSVLCTLGAGLIDENHTTFTVNNEIEESKSMKATVSGSTATCTVSLPYSWYLSSPSTDTVSLNYQLSIVSSTAVNELGVARTSYQYVPGAGSIKVPSSGTTTTYTISATI